MEGEMTVKLMTKEIEERIPRLYETEEVATEEKVVHVKFFSPANGLVWYGVEYDPKERLFFGLIDGFEREWGYFSLDEFEEVNKKYSYPVIERDVNFKPTKIKDLDL